MSEDKKLTDKNVIIEVFYSETCPNCPPQKKLVKKFKNKKDNIEIELLNVAKNKKRAKKHGISAVPTTIIKGSGLDENIGFKGVMKEETLETAIKVAKGEKNLEALETPEFFEIIKEKIKNIW